MDKSTRTKTGKRISKERETNATLIKDPIMLQEKSHFIANVKCDKCLYRAVESGQTDQCVSMSLEERADQ